LNSKYNMIMLESGEKINISKLEPFEERSKVLYLYTSGNERYIIKVFTGVEERDIVRRVNAIKDTLMRQQKYSGPIPEGISRRGIPIKSGWGYAKAFGFTNTNNSIIPLLVFNYVDGKTLWRYIREDSQILDEKRKNIARQLLTILIYLQDAGIVHNDLYPDNFIISKEKGREEKVYILDLESAGILHKSRKTWLWEPLTLGKGHYMFCPPPEIEKRGETSIFSDRWVGTYLIFWTLCGFHPIPFLNRIDETALDSLYSATDKKEITWPPRLKEKIPYERKDYPIDKFKKFMDKYFGHTNFPRILFYTYIIGYKDYTRRPGFREVKESLKGIL
jgi:serine/threonine protein kinase